MEPKRKSDFRLKVKKVEFYEKHAAKNRPRILRRFLKNSHFLGNRDIRYDTDVEF